MNGNGIPEEDQARTDATENFGRMLHARAKRTGQTEFNLGELVQEGAI